MRREQGRAAPPSDPDLGGDVLDVVPMLFALTIRRRANSVLGQPPGHLSVRGYGCTVALGPDPAGVSVAELVATLSYAADLGLGQPMAHCMRQTVIALRLADLVGASDEDRRATYYLGLMMNSWCHADAAEQARWFGDDISFKGDGYETLGMNTAQTVAFLVRRVGSHGSGGAAHQTVGGVSADRPRAGQRVPTDPLRARRRVRRTYRLE